MNREELYDYLCKTSGAYYLIKYNGNTEPLHFMSYNGSFFESPCTVYQYKMTPEELEDYVKDLWEDEYQQEGLEYCKSMYIDGTLYEIENFQCSPFLKNDIEVLKVFATDRECLDWILNNKQ